MNASALAELPHLISSSSLTILRRLLLVLPFFWVLAVQAADHQILAEDDAADGAYKDGWKADGGGSGFGNWSFQSSAKEGTESHAGFFIATKEHNGDLKGAAIQSKAFGLYANGIAFEVATAFRSLKKPLAVGQTFSFLLQNGPFEKKFDQAEPTGGSIGLTLRAGTSAGSVEDYNKGARFELGCYQGQATYQVYDGESNHDTGIALVTGGLSVSITLVTADTYDLEITTLAEKKTTTLKGRKLGGEAGAKLESFCLFNRNAEKNDAFFNGFQVIGTGD